MDIAEWRLEFEGRIKAFVLRVIRLVESLPRTRSAEVIGKQLLRAAMSTGANFRASRRARSKAEFLSKLGIAEEEADECVYWIDLLISAKLIRASRLHGLLQEANEILAIIVASIRTARRPRQ